MQNGMVEVYIGDGKGKSTAAIGLALRCYGSGGRALVLQFLKTRTSGEVDAIADLHSERFLIRRFESEHDLIFDDPTELDLEYLRKDIQNAYEYAYSSITSGQWDVVVLDEILWAQYFNLLSIEQLLNLIKNKSMNTELVLTGRYAPDEVLQLADYITQMSSKRHPYDKGVQARRYIEF